MGGNKYYGLAKRSTVVYPQTRLLIVSLKAYFCDALTFPVEWETGTTFSQIIS